MGGKRFTFLYGSPYELCNIMFHVLRLDTFVFNKCSEKNIFTIITVVKTLQGFG